MPSTFVHGLLPSSCAVLTHRKVPMTKKEWFLFFFFCSFFANSPDLDIVPVIFYPKAWDFFHRNVGHNLFSVSLLIAIGYWVFQKFFSKHFSKKQCFTIAFLIVGSHIFLDALGDYQKNGLRVGVPIFWPLSGYHFKLPFALFMNYHLKVDAPHPLLGHLLSIEFWKFAFWNEIYYSVILFCLWVSVSYFYRTGIKIFFTVFARKEKPPMAS